MKKLIIILICTTLFLCGCSINVIGNDEEYVEPYQFSESDEDLLSMFGVDIGNEDSLIEFSTKKTKKIIFTQYVLDLGNDMWVEVGSAQMAFSEKIDDIRYSGFISLQKNEDYSYNIIIKCSGKGSFKTKSTLDLESLTLKGTAFMETKCYIKIEKEIPIMISAFNDGNTFNSFTVNDYYSPEIFKNMDHVVAFTIKFM